MSSSLSLRVLRVALVLVTLASPTIAAAKKHAPSPSPAASSMATGSAMTTGKLTTYPTEAAAGAQCGADTVVWVNTKSKVYHLKGTTYYGKTKAGGYACKAAADAAGDHAASMGKSMKSGAR